VADHDGCCICKMLRLYFREMLEVVPPQRGSLVVGEGAKSLAPPRCALASGPSHWKHTCISCEACEQHVMPKLMLLTAYRSLSVRRYPLRGSNLRSTLGMTVGSDFCVLLFSHRLPPPPCTSPGERTCRIGRWPQGRWDTLLWKREQGFRMPRAVGST
jgi:hypothetical protein